jgi:tripartite-type tricarboxylate transporter receptor subunit TctC
MKKGMERRDFLKLAAASGATLLLPKFAFGAETWPERPPTGVVGFGPGGGIDMVGRSLSAAMEPFIGTNINVINKGGASSSIAMDYVWTKPPDGYWWLFVSKYAGRLRAMKMHQTCPWKDWQHFRAGATIWCVSVIPESPIKDFADLLDRAKKNPGKIKVSNGGIAGMEHFGVMLLQKSAGVKFHHVPYDGGKKATLAALQKEVDVVAHGIHVAISYLKAGKLRHLAAFQADPMKIGKIEFIPITKYVPAAKKYCPYGGGASMALRRDTDVAILKKIEKAFWEAQKDPRYKAFLEKQVIMQFAKSGKEADREAAFTEVSESWLLKELGLAKLDPEKDLGLPKLDDFDEWWPPKDYKPVL